MKLSTVAILASSLVGFAVGESRKQFLFNVKENKALAIDDTTSPLSVQLAQPIGKQLFYLNGGATGVQFESVKTAGKCVEFAVVNGENTLQYGDCARDEVIPANQRWQLAVVEGYIMNTDFISGSTYCWKVNENNEIVLDLYSIFTPNTCTQFTQDIVPNLPAKLKFPRDSRRGCAIAHTKLKRQIPEPMVWFDRCKDVPEQQFLLTERAGNIYSYSTNPEFAGRCLDFEQRRFGNSGNDVVALFKPCADKPEQQWAFESFAMKLRDGQKNQCFERNSDIYPILLVKECGVADTFQQFQYGSSVNRDAVDEENDIVDESKTNTIILASSITGGVAILVAAVGYIVVSRKNKNKVVVENELSTQL